MLLLLATVLVKVVVGSSGSSIISLQSSQLCTNGLEQSPINIISGSAVEDCSEMRIELFSIEKPVQTSISLVDNTFTLTTPMIYSFAYIATDDGNVGLFVAKQARLHFSSEHYIDGEKYDAEIQLMFETDPSGDQWYRNMMVAVVMTEVADNDDTATTLFDGVSFDHPTAFAFTLSPITSSIENSTFYFYHGSKTTGDCQQNVLWYVSDVVLPIRSSHLQLIKSMSVGRRNNKDLSELHSRKVYALNSTCNLNSYTVSRDHQPWLVLPLLLIVFLLL